jgi:hypothetical protein
MLHISDNLAPGAYPTGPNQPRHPIMQPGTVERCHHHLYLVRYPRDLSCDSRDRCVMFQILRGVEVSASLKRTKDENG